MGGTGLLCQTLLLSLMGTIVATLEGSCDDLHKWRLLLGAWDIQWAAFGPLGPRVQERKPVQILTHEQHSIQLNTNDIALVEMDHPAPCDDVVQIVCLPRSAESPIRAPESRIVAGWGFKRAGSAKPVVQEAKVTVMDLDKCNQSDWYHGLVHSNNLCTSCSDENMDT
uniref:Acrosin-like isoform X2 n=1 Tax=Phascolarctos cinereus TaxID=38626 RepID=A0A6P5K0K8_PHACI|nr:acrosin-like isoform X2 [Phascolarctos cinereus]